jgi:chemotaxis signal transduction protein
MAISESNTKDQNIGEASILLCQINGKLFGFPAGQVKIITEFTSTDSSVILEPNIGSIKLSDSKIPLFNISGFLELSPTLKLDKYSSIIVSFDGKSFFALLADNILGVVDIETFYQIPKISVKYQDIYSSLFYFRDKLILLLNLEQIFKRIISKERLRGHL